MELKYSLTRTEIVLTFLRGLAKSPKLLMRVLVYCLLPGLVSLAMSGALSRKLTLGDAVYVVRWTIGMFFFIVVWVFIRAKTGRRTMTVNEDGISTSIGELSGWVPWSKVADVKNSDKHALVIGSSGNSFFIPNRAFSSPDEKLQFISEINKWSRE